LFNASLHRPRPQPLQFSCTEVRPGPRLFVLFFVVRRLIRGLLSSCRTLQLALVTCCQRRRVVPCTAFAIPKGHAVPAAASSFYQICLQAGSSAATPVLMPATRTPLQQTRRQPAKRLQLPILFVSPATTSAKTILLLASEAAAAAAQSSSSCPPPHRHRCLVLQVSCHATPQDSRGRIHILLLLTPQRAAHRRRQCGVEVRVIRDAL